MEAYCKYAYPRLKIPYIVPAIPMSVQHILGLQYL